MIAVVNKSTKMSSADVHIAVRACAHQLRYDAAPVWDKAPVPVIYYTDESHAPPGAWIIAVFDDADQAGDLGWHTEGPDGLPYGRVFVSPVLDNGGDALTKNLSVASVLSHEVLEAFVDPSVNFCADDFGGGIWALEVGDPVESDSYEVPVVVDARTVLVTVSNFVTPAWFDPQNTHGPWDWMHKTKGPFQLAPGGYAIKNGNAIWGEKYPKWRQEQKVAEFSSILHGDKPVGRSARRVR
jgi:hypothetical protein